MYKRMIYILIGLAAMVMAVGPAAAPSPAAATGGIAGNGPKAVFPQSKYEFQPVSEGVKITHDFIIENHGDAPLVIKNIRPD